jgi:hypothetical protein
MVSRVTHEGRAGIGLNSEGAMKFKLTYEIDLTTMRYEIKLDDKGLTDQQCYDHCARALRVMEAHLFHSKPNPTSVN